LGSELIGHVRNAFTGAYTAREGKIFDADRGTLFLDEVDSLQPTGQGYLLTLLEGTEPIIPLGGSQRDGRERPKMRIISASLRGLEAAGLRGDLIQRLGAETIRIPNVEERREDLPSLFETILVRLRAQLHAEIQLSPDVVIFLRDRDWPGQLREIDQALTVVTQRRIGAATRDGSHSRRFTLSQTDFESYFQDRQDGRNLPTQVHAREQDLMTRCGPPLKRKEPFNREDIERALQLANGNITHAARATGVVFNTFSAKMKEFGVTAEPFRTPRAAR
jgi:DNA-binding NtrC family response regulator